jgi:hypothetical protein
MMMLGYLCVNCSKAFLDKKIIGYFGLHTFDVPRSSASRTIIDDQRIMLGAVPSNPKLQSFLYYRICDKKVGMP